ncbi:hypothetical protein, partial [uncultured Duncaniella sp.]|uniref:hypothetical protein n=1 Tax=uncultured Duncaniella sp. TaxID=2768039 RepID=UPI002664FED2
LNLHIFIIMISHFVTFFNAIIFFHSLHPIYQDNITLFKENNRTFAPRKQHLSYQALGNSKKD